MEWKVTRFCEFSSGNGRAELPLISNFCDGSQVCGYPSWLICIHRVRQQKSLMSPVINGPRCVPGGTRRTDNLELLEWEHFSVIHNLSAHQRQH